MTRDEQLEFCKKCTNRKMDFQKGLVCGLTNEKADFEDTCPDFNEDTNIEEVVPGSYAGEEDLSEGLKVLSFCFPIIGGILYFVNMNSAPKKAKSACTMALWGVGIGIVLRVIMTILANM
jgi:hypothetical protein